ncbi:MAG: hypothetical protein WD097_00235 [Balneolales bacterium]
MPRAVWREVEQPVLQNLPSHRYQLWDLQTRKVSQLGHIAYRYNYYSVPSEYAGRQVNVQCNESLVAIYYENQKLTVHALYTGTGHYISCDEHRPAYKRKKSREEYVCKMAAIGTHAMDFMEALEHNKPRHWHEMCSGILQLTKTWPRDAVNHSCRRALHYRALSYREVKTILEENLWELPIEEESIQRVPQPGHGHPLGIYDQLSSTMEASHGTP